MAFCGSRVQAFQQYLEEKIQECKCRQRQEKVPLTVQTGNAAKQAWNHRKEHFLTHFMLKRKINVPNTREAVWPKEATRLHTHPDGQSHETLTDIDLVSVCVGNTLRPHPRIEHLDFRRRELKVKRSGLIGQRCSDGSKDTQTLHWRRVSGQSVAWSEDPVRAPGELAQRAGAPGHGGAWEPGHSGAPGQKGRQRSRGAEKRPAPGRWLPHAPRPGRKRGPRE